MNNRMEKACYNIVVNAGVIPKPELDRIFQESENLPQATFSQLLVQSGLIREADLLNLYSKNLGIPCVNLKAIQIDKSAIEKVPIKFAWYYKFFPVKLEERKLTIAVSRILEVNIVDEIRLGLGYELKMALASSSDIEEQLKKHYGLAADTVEKILNQSGGEAATTAQMPVPTEVENIEKLAETASVAQLVNEIILDAYKKRASDIHLEPFRGKVRVRYRIDGVLHEASMSSELWQFYLPILSRFKIMANLNIVERRLPQDGKARVKTQDQTLDLRISSIPTPLGESMVIRLLPSKMIFSIDKLGFESEQQKVLTDLLKRPHGIIFVTGPTGSGKSTTLYAGLSQINMVERKVITIEDPIEYELEGVTQIQVLPEIGLTFARGLRSMLRHDPDVMMVGEVRDLETADIAIRMALTGHLLLSTLHTNDAASGVTRLLDIGVEPYLIASSVVAFIAQRLVRVICPKCKIEDTSALAEVKQLIRQDLSLNGNDPVKVYKGRGCEVCNHTGFSGRIAILEILMMNEALRKLIFSRASSDEIKAKAIQMGTRTLRQNGWKKVLDGITTPDEIIKVAPVDEMFKFSLSDVPVTPEETITTEGFVDRRKYVRAMLKIRIVFRSVDYEFSEKITDDKSKEYEGETENISAGGVVFTTFAAFKVGDVLELKIETPDEEKTFIQCLCRVVRVNQVNDVAEFKDRFLFRIATSFLAISSSDRKILDHFCKGLNGDEKI